MNQQPVRNRNSKNERRRVKRDQAKKQTRKKREIRQASAKGKEIAFHIAKTIGHFFPDLWERLNSLSDPRKKSLNIPWQNL